MSHNLEGMVAVASGTSEAVKRWCEALKKASIHCVVSHQCDEDTSKANHHAELWVRKKDVDEARAVLRNGSKRNEVLIW
jgi:hypothetical protein